MHETMLDCNIVNESNPKSTIYPSFQKANRNFVYTPNMAKFLSHGFFNFQVAFWDSKSTQYMEDDILAMLSRLKESPKCIHVFVWSTQHCQNKSGEDKESLILVKPLEKVYMHRLRWNASNTLVIDDNISRVACNPKANIIIPTLCNCFDFLPSKSYLLMFGKKGR